MITSFIASSLIQAHIFLPVTINVSILSWSFEHQDMVTYRKSYAILRSLGQQEYLFEFVARHLTRTDGSKQRELISSVMDFPLQAKRAVPQLRSIAGSPNVSESNRTGAIWMLGFIGPVDSLGVGPFQLIGLEDRRTLKTLRKCRDEQLPQLPAGTVLPDGTKILSSPSGEDAALRCAACLALWKIEGRVESIAPTLIALLHSEVLFEKELTIKTIAEIGAPLKQSVGPYILALMYSDDRSDRNAVYPLIPIFAPNKEWAAKGMAKALIRADEEYRTASSRLREELDSGRITLRRYAVASRHLGAECRILKGTLASLGDAAIPELISLLRHKDGGVRYDALNALRLMKIEGNGVAAKKAIDEVKKLLSDADPSVKDLAATTIKELTLD